MSSSRRLHPRGRHDAYGLCRKYLSQPPSLSLTSSLIAPTPSSLAHPTELEQITDSGSYTVGPILQQRNLQHRRVRLRRQLHGLEQEHCRGPPIVHWRSGLPSLCRSRLPGSRRGNFGHQERHGGECGQLWWSHALGRSRGRDQRGGWPKLQPGCKGGAGMNEFLWNLNLRGDMME